jgi:hypothetical protein
VQTQDISHRLQCSGMYSRKAWGGNVDSFILTKFAKVTPPDDANPLVSLVIFEWTDENLIGRQVSDDPEVSTSYIACRKDRLAHFPLFLPRNTNQFAIKPA